MPGGETGVKWDKLTRVSSKYDIQLITCDKSHFYT